MAKFMTLIVGAHFRPPAKQVLAHLPAQHQLQLLAEPDNPYDPAAVKVMLDPLTIPESQLGPLAEELPNCGLTLEMLMSGGHIQLGYLPAQEGNPLRKAREQRPELLGNQQVGELITIYGPEHVIARTQPRLDGGLDIELEVPDEASQLDDLA